MPADAMLLRFRELSEPYNNGELFRCATSSSLRLLRRLMPTVRNPMLDGLPWILDREAECQHVAIRVY
jgi:hypothetical protein